MSEIVSTEALKKMRELTKRAIETGHLGFINKALSYTGMQLIGYIQENKLSGQVLKVRSNKLRGGLALKQTIDDNNRKKVIMTSAVGYALIHEFGGTIRPKKAGALTFQVDGNWIRAKVVDMPERAYIRPSISERRQEIVADYVYSLQRSLEMK